jgi:hypothetical protein
MNALGAELIPVEALIRETRATARDGVVVADLVSPQVGPIGALATRTLSVGEAYWAAPVVDAGEKE